MSIFEFLDMAPRKDNKVTQLVKHWDEVSDKHKGPEKTFGLQVKKDGVCSLTVIRDGEVAIFSRTGKEFTNTTELLHAISSLNLRDGVYMGEMTCDMVSLEKLSGIVNPKRVKPLDFLQKNVADYGLEMNFFDLISIESFIEGASQTPYSRRFFNLVNRLQSVFPCDTISVLPVHFDCKGNFFQEQVDDGEEGIVIIDMDAGWEAGHKGWRKMKKVRGVDYDLTCIGVEEGTGKYAGKVANLIFNWKDGKTIKAMLGKGWTHDDAAYFFTNPPIGALFQVYALEESSKGKLRLPKVGEKRHDKVEADV